MADQPPNRRQQLADELDRVHAQTMHPHGSRAAWLAVADRVIAKIDYARKEAAKP